MLAKDCLTTPIFSCIISTYERPEPLRLCLKSIINQVFDKSLFEVVVVDDGSTCDNYNVISLFKNQMNIRYIHQSHRGIPSTRNTGATHAHGKFLSFIDDDYILPPDLLKQTDLFFKTHPDAKVVTFNIRSCGWGLGPMVQRLYTELALWQNIKEDYQTSKIVTTDSLAVGRGATFLRDFFSRAGGFNETLRGGEDTELTLRLSRVHVPIHFLTKIYIQHWERNNFFGFLRQRYNYGVYTYELQRQSKINSTVNTHGNKNLSSLSLGRIIHFTWRTYRVLSGTAKRIHKSFHFTFLTPFLLMFILYFWLGFFTHVRNFRKTTLRFDPNDRSLQSNQIN